MTSSKIFRKYAITRTGYQFFFFHENEGGGYYDYYLKLLYYNKYYTTKYLVDTICMGVCTNMYYYSFSYMIGEYLVNTSCEL